MGIRESSFVEYVLCILLLLAGSVVSVLALMFGIHYLCDRTDTEADRRSLSYDPESQPDNTPTTVPIPQPPSLKELNVVVGDLIFVVFHLESIGVMLFCSHALARGLEYPTLSSVNNWVTSITLFSLVSAAGFELPPAMMPRVLARFLSGVVAAGLRWAYAAPDFLSSKEKPGLFYATVAWGLVSFWAAYLAEWKLGFTYRFCEATTRFILAENAAARGPLDTPEAPRVGDNV